MARIFNEDAYNAKRDEILDAAMSLIYSKGYEQMTIQDILDSLQISRGALYHYFDSKQVLLEALVERSGKQAERSILRIIQDPNLSALEKFQRYFEASASWKNAQKELITGLLRVWYADGNMLIRHKMTAQTMKQTPLLLEPIIRQGIQEKVFTTRFPKQAAQMIVGIILNISDTLIDLASSQNPERAAGQEMETVLKAYTDGIERILGAPPGSLKGLNTADFKDWVDALQPEPVAK